MTYTLAVLAVVLLALLGMRVRRVGQVASAKREDWFEIQMRRLGE